MRLTFDHIAVGCSDLAAGTGWVETQLGVTLQLGGKHRRYGTHNTLLGLGDLYLEVIAPDPNAAAFDGPRWFALDRFSGPPRLANWICQTTQFDPIAGPPRDLSRGDLRWQLTVPEDGSLPYDGAYPTLIKWGAGSAHPASTLRDSGCRLRSFVVSHPEAGRIAAMCDLTDPRVQFRKGPKGFSASFDTPSGVRHL
ncbi:VOC family protein [Yoonia sp. BS5-3]|uniref:VOC family protein n=1 Tax=Yoonia phaeophyticola TaxID=3137369 RepID=A0ABZ2VBC0_9RHOB